MNEKSIYYENWKSKNMKMYEKYLDLTTNSTLKQFLLKEVFQHLLHQIFKL